MPVTAEPQGCFFRARATVSQSKVLMKINLPAFAAVAVVTWFFLPRRPQRANADCETTPEPADFEVNEGIGRSIRQSDNEQLYTLGTRPGVDPECNGIVPGLRDDL